MNDVFLFISSIIIIFSFICYFMMIIFGNKKVTDSDGFDITKDIISEYNSINVIESKSYFTIYNIKRKVIKLSSHCYYGNGIGNVCLCLIEAGISVIDNNKNISIDFFRKIISNLKMLYIFPVLSLLINYSTYNINDAKVSLVFMIIFSIISYFLIDIKCQSCDWVNDNIKKVDSINSKNANEIISYINKFILIDKFIFLGELIMIIRCVSILLKIN